jgi:O-antigen/teichoic acid export membrane protein
VDAPDPAPGVTYGRGAATLSLGIGATGLMTYGYFSLASHSLSAPDYGGITLLWSAVFITVNVLYRPVEQLLSRTIADRHARGREGGEHLRIAAAIQLALAGVFIGVALAVRRPLEHNLFGGSRTLYVVLLVAVLSYAASYFARGFLAGHRWFSYYGGLMLLEATSRILFALLVTLGFASGQPVVAFGIAAAPIVSLTIIPWALARRLSPLASGPARAQTLRPDSMEDAAFTFARGVGFVAPVVLVMLSEQAFLNAGPVVVKATETTGGAALAGFTFNVLLITRGPLQLFQAVQTSILPHLTRLKATGASDTFRRSVSVTIAAITGFAAVVMIVMLVVGPQIMDLLFGSEFHYSRVGLVMVALGMGLYLTAATLNQAALAAGRAREAAACWVASASAFVSFLVVPGFDDRVLQVEIGYLGGAMLLCALLYGLYRWRLGVRRPRNPREPRLR